jgi:two-component system chemotaxis sensor kinase CheA
MDEAVAEFILESHENLDQLDRDLVSLESHPAARDTLARVFRTIHTIKGTCGFLGYSNLESVAHAGEGLLSRLRDGEIAFHREIADALLALVDAVRRMLASIETTRRDGDEDHGALIERLTRLQGAAPPAAPSSAQPAGRAKAGVAPASALAESSVRVDVGLLDRLMTLVGELVLTRNQIVQIAAARREPAHLTASQRLNLITSQLQEGVMKLRLQPIANLSSRLPRQVRDLAAACGKWARVVMEGMETELDRSLLEAIKDPLTHLVRNAIDHGLEAPEAREAAGKSPQGTISLRAYHEGGRVHIEIADDGAGVDPVRVREEAVRRGHLDAEAASGLSERETLDLIFLPGFSTARSVTSVSGRGARGAGTTILITLPLTLAIIPTLIVRCGSRRYALPQASLLELVRLEGRSLEGRSLEGRSAVTGIERVHGAPVHRLRGDLLPLVDLGRELEPSRRSARALSGSADGVVHLVVLRSEGRTFGLVVDGIEDTEEIVVRPLGRHLKRIPIFAGATVLGDGGVALILDVTGLAQRARVVGAGHARAAFEPRAAATAEPQVPSRTLLLFDVKGGRRLAVPLSAVARLEEFEDAAIERLGAREVVQYRSTILPLLRISSLLGEEEGVARPGGTFQVVVYSDGERSAGLVVDRIHDIVEEPLTLSRSGGGEGSAIIQRRVTEILDLPRILSLDEDAFPEGAAPLEARR